MLAESVLLRGSDAEVYSTDTHLADVDGADPSCFAASSSNANSRHTLARLMLLSGFSRETS